MNQGHRNGAAAAQPGLFESLPQVPGMPQAGRLRRQTVEHTFGTLESWMGATRFQTRTLPRVRTETSLLVLAYNRKRVMQIVGVQPLIAAMRA